MQDGKVTITERDITTNLPYVAAAHLAFDHHESETIRNTGERPNHIITAHAPSAARVVFDYYGGAPAFPNIKSEGGWHDCRHRDRVAARHGDGPHHS